MKRFLAILILLFPVVSSGCVGCQPGGSGSQAVDYNPGDGFRPTADPSYVDGEPLDMRDKH